MGITIRCATIEDKPAIFAFLEKAYGEKAKFKYPERWEWQFENNPYKPNSEIPVYIAVTDDGEVVAQSAAVFEPLQIEGYPQEFAWAVDAFVLEEYRGQNLGFETLRLNRDKHPLWMGMVMATSSRHILTKLGCMEIDPVFVYQKLVNMDKKSVVKAMQNKLTRFPPAFSLISTIERLHLDFLLTDFINLIIRFKDAFRLSLSKSTVTIKKKEVFGSEFDEFWEKVVSSFRVGITRDSNFLQWKYQLQPDMNYQIFAAERNGEMSGYIILRSAMEQEKTGIIADILVHPDDAETLRGLVNHAVRYFKDAKMKYISAASNSAGFREIFESLGFKLIRELLPLVYIDEALLEENKNYLSSDSWLLGRSDHDWDQLFLG